MKLQQISQAGFRYYRVREPFTETKVSHLLFNMFLNMLWCQVFFDRKVCKLNCTYLMFSATFSWVLLIIPSDLTTKLEHIVKTFCMFWNWFSGSYCGPSLAVRSTVAVAASSSSVIGRAAKDNQRRNILVWPLYFFLIPSKVRSYVSSKPWGRFPSCFLTSFLVAQCLSSVSCNATHRNLKPNLALNFTF